MFAWTRRLFASWRHFGEYLIFLAVCLAGILNTSWLSIPIGAMALLLLGWSRYRDLFARADRADAEWRDLAARMRGDNVGSGLAYYLRSKTVTLVLGIKLLHDSAFLVGAFLFGHAIAWLWGVR